MAARPAPPLLKTLPLLRLRIRLCLHHHDFLTSAIFPPLRLPFCSSASSGSAWSEENVLSSASEFLRVKEPPKFFDRFDGPSYRKWKDKEDEILRDIEPITLLAKDILHSDSEVLVFEAVERRRCSGCACWFSGVVLGVEVVFYGGERSGKGMILCVLVSGLLVYLVFMAVEFFLCIGVMSLGGGWLGASGGVLVAGV